MLLHGIDSWVHSIPYVETLVPGGAVRMSQVSDPLVVHRLRSNEDTPFLISTPHSSLVFRSVQLVLPPDRIIPRTSDHVQGDSGVVRR
jgi:hypothetical protein